MIYKDMDPKTPLTVIQDLFLAKKSGSGEIDVLRVAEITHNESSLEVHLERIPKVPSPTPLYQGLEGNMDEQGRYIQKEGRYIKKEGRYIEEFRGANSILIVVVLYGALIIIVCMGLYVILMRTKLSKLESELEMYKLMRSPTTTSWKASSADEEPVPTPQTALCNTRKQMSPQSQTYNSQWSTNGQRSTQNETPMLEGVGCMYQMHSSNNLPMLPDPCSPSHSHLLFSDDNYNLSPSEELLANHPLPCSNVLSQLSEFSQAPLSLPPRMIVEEVGSVRESTDQDTGSPSPVCIMSKMGGNTPGPEYEESKNYSKGERMEDVEEKRRRESSSPCEMNSKQGASQRKRKVTKVASALQVTKVGSELQLNPSSPNKSKKDGKRDRSLEMNDSSVSEDCKQSQGVKFKEEENKDVVCVHETRQILENGRFNKLFEQLEVLGEGGFGKVYKVQNKVDDQIYAVKTLHIHLGLDQDIKTHKVFRELFPLLKLDHKNMVRYYTTWVELESKTPMLFNPMLRKYRGKHGNRHLPLPKGNWTPMTPSLGPIRAPARRMEEKECTTDSVLPTEHGYQLPYKESRTRILPLKGRGMFPIAALPQVLDDSEESIDDQQNSSGSHINMSDVGFDWANSDDGVPHNWEEEELVKQPNAPKEPNAPNAPDTQNPKVPKASSPKKYRGSGKLSILGCIREGSISPLPSIFRVKSEAKLSLSLDKMPNFKLPATFTSTATATATMTRGKKMSPIMGGESADSDEGELPVLPPCSLFPDNQAINLRETKSANILGQFLEDDKKINREDKRINREEKKQEEDTRITTDQKDQKDQKDLKDLKDQDRLPAYEADLSSPMYSHSSSWRSSVNNDELEKAEVSKSSSTSNRSIPEATSVQRLVRNNEPYYKAILHIQMEYCESQSLKQLLQERKGVDRKQNYYFFKQMVVAVKELHSNGIIHRDLKPANIFISKNGQLKLGDFGLSIGLDALRGRRQSSKLGGICGGKNIWKLDDNLSTKIGTRNFSAPEQETSTKYNQKVDMYSLGLVLFELCCNFVTQHERMNGISKLRKEKVI